MLTKPKNNQEIPVNIATTNHPLEVMGERIGTTIVEIRLVNYKRFKNYTIKPNRKANIFVGDNEVGKSSILEAIDLVASGNLRKVESIGIDRLLNIDAVQTFTNGSRSFDKLPKMIVELYLKGSFDHTMNGKNNTANVVCDGIKLVCEASTDYQAEIVESMQKQNDYFPYDYYSIRFSTFADEAYTGYKKKLRSVLINSTNMNSEYATNDFIRRMYNQYTEDDTKERAVHKSKYRQLKNSFRSDCFTELNARVSASRNYAFGLKLSSVSGLESDLMIFEDQIGIDNKGAGMQVFIKTDFALERSWINIDVVLIEEPENHLSQVNLRKLVQRVSETQSGQLFIATHNSLISTRLELRNLLIMHDGTEEEPITLHDLSEDTAKYFLKAPVASILEFVLSAKAVLVEGPSEYMLFEKFYESTIGHKPEIDDVYVIDVRGLSFKRYLEIAKLLKSKVAVVTDNDGDKQKHCVDKYSKFSDDCNIKICYENDNENKTFENVLYSNNKTLCNRLFGENALEYMLNNKTEASYLLLEQKEAIIVPTYIQEAIKWIKG